ncbi:MAG: nitroreductase [Parcubacteria group bacterium GW2011_GWC2_39_14]|nr:MAG: nitroreductase [Parcubacteria group bacterium GW2011_GWC2_39_14]KKR54342.1 MAG: nitroreductase [Parcubacteria group bacterium GW2011_GWA2_40_23]
MRNKLLQFINTRRSIRSFTKRKVTKKQLEQIAEAGLRAPSSKNAQPWYLVVLQGKEKNRIADCIRDDMKNYDCVPTNVTDGKKIKGMFDSTNESIKIIEESSAVILIFNREVYSQGFSEAKGKRIDARQLYTYAVEVLGLGACMQNILLAAHAQNLGAVAMADVYPGAVKIKKLFKLEYQFMIGVAIGYPAYKTKKREVNFKKLVKFVE